MEKGSSELFKLPFVRIAPFMAVGVLLAYFGGSAVCAIVFVCAAAFAVCLAIKKRSGYALCAAGLMAGILITGLYVHLYCDPILEYSGKTIRAEFVVREITYASGDTQRVTASVTLGGRSAKVSLYCENALAVGQRATADIELGEYDEERRLYNLANGILLSGSAENIEFEPISAKTASVGLLLQTLRNELIGGIERIFFGDERELVKALLFGEDSGLSQAARERLKICGAAHFTAVSGSHFAILGAVLAALIPKKRRRLKALFPLVFAPMAVIFFGTSASVIRAAVMFFIGGLALVFRRKAETLNTLCAAFTIIALFSPGIILDVGFAMSVFGVFGVGVVGVKLSERVCERIPKKAGFFKAPVTAFITSICAVVCTSPISAAFFKGVSLFGAVSSLLLMILITAGAVFALIGAVTGSALIAVPSVYAMRAADWFIDLFGSGDFRGLWLPLNFDGAWIIAAIFALLLTVGVFSSSKNFVPTVGCMAALAVFSVGMSLHTVDAQSEICFAGNSRSDAAIVLNGDTAAVVISGTGGGLAGKLSQTLREHGVRRVSLLMAESADFTGALAIAELSELIEIEEIYSTPAAAAVLSDRKVEIIGEDSVLDIGGVTIAAAQYSESEISADIAVYYGSFRSVPKSSARIAAVYFSGFERELPENGVNALRDEIVIKINKGQWTVAG